MITPAQCRMARAALQIGVRELAEISGVSAMTITRFETGKTKGYAETLDKLQRALEAAGVECIPAGPYQGDSGPGVRLRSSASVEGLLS